MPREGISHPVDDLWRERVVARLEELDKKPKWLADESGAPRSMISELLSGKRQSSTYLPEIHKVLKWDPPLGPLLSLDDEELLKIARGLDVAQRARLMERAVVIREEKKKR